MILDAQSAATLKAALREVSPIVVRCPIAYPFLSTLTRTPEGIFSIPKWNDFLPLDAESFSNNCSASLPTAHLLWPIYPHTTLWSQHSSVTTTIE
jgi:hypothetical protein